MIHQSKVSEEMLAEYSPRQIINFCSSFWKGQRVIWFKFGIMGNDFMTCQQTFIMYTIRIPRIASKTMRRKNNLSNRKIKLLGL
jgi:hypothetical protein